MEAARKSPSPLGELDMFPGLFEDDPAEDFRLEANSLRNLAYDLVRRSVAGRRNPERPVAPGAGGEE